MSAIYIAGPMRGYPYFNFPEFFLAEHHLQESWETVLNPARDDSENGFPWRDCPHGTQLELNQHQFDLRATLKKDLCWICDHASAIALLPGWTNSAGARSEAQLAQALSLPAYEMWGPDLFPVNLHFTAEAADVVQVTTRKPQIGRVTYDPDA